MKSAKERVRPVIRKLKKTFPDARCSLVHRNPLELLVSTILSAQCTDDRVNLVTADLFRVYKTAMDYANASPEVLETQIKSTGFYRNKAKSIINMSQRLVDEHGGKVPRTMDALVKLPGVGRKTANVVLGNAFGIDEGVVVDTHVRRITNRLGFTDQQDPVKVEQDLIKLVPKKEWTIFPHLLIHHGRSICQARTPKCDLCPVADLCPSVNNERISQPTERYVTT
ncbi:MAG: endonuclease III [Gemmatimonadales bacterium]